MSSIHDNYSENEDDPAVYESSGDEWEEATEKKRNKRRTSQRLSKKPRVTHVESSESEHDDSKPKSKNGINKKTKKAAVSPPSSTTAPAEYTAPIQQTVPVASKAPTNFITGTFVILKKDAQSGDITNPPCIWKIDGKALLQKYEPFEDNGKVKHRNTSIYTGWSALDKDQYAPIQVQICLHSGQKMIVELNWDQLKDINIDSD